MTTTPPATPEELREIASQHRASFEETCGNLRNCRPPYDEMASIFASHLRKSHVSAWACEQMAAQLEREDTPERRANETKLRHYLKSVGGEMPAPSAPSGDAAVENVVWMDRPTANGWWFWSEKERREERLLIVANGKQVASDDEWERATGTPVELNGINFNYWEGTETTQAMMPGKWRRELTPPSPSRAETK